MDEELKEIIRDIAAMDPLYYVIRDEILWQQCKFCGLAVDYHPEHSGDCLWILLNKKINGNPIVVQSGERILNLKENKEYSKK